MLEAGIEQGNRALILSTPLGAQVLLPQRVVGESRIGREFEMTVDVVSRERVIELKKLMAKPVTLWVRQRDNSYLAYHGFVFATRRLGSDGGMTYYQLSFSSWMRFLRHRKDARIFQNRTTADILAEVFDGHSHARGQYRFDLRDRGATHSYCTQYDSDHNFVHRLMESEGWFTYIEQAENGKSHTVVITDDMYRFKPLETQDITFYRAERMAGADALVEWSSERIVQSVAYAIRTPDYKQPNWPRERSGTSTDEHGDVPSELEVYEYAGHYSFPPREAANDRGSLAVQYRIEEHESRTKRFYGVGSVLGMDAGRWFDLRNHPEHDSDKPQDQEFATIAVRWCIQNNLPLGNSRPFPHSLQRQLTRVRAQYKDMQSLFTSRDESGNESFFLVEIEAQRRRVPYRSPFDHKKPLMHMQTATVVGPAGEEIFTDELNRVKVQMHWDRLGSNDQSSSCWMRVVSPNAGGGFGGVFVPRVGHEVAIDYVDGD